MITFGEARKIVRKFNENHGSDGKFASASGQAKEASKEANRRSNSHFASNLHSKAADLHFKAATAAYHAGNTKIQRYHEAMRHGHISASMRDGAKVNMKNGSFTYKPSALTSALQDMSDSFHGAGKYKR